ncbi:hypothetical protein MMC24_006718 [Lignoscripta atroalba]|nr:hypothetical protein [Lignoscripta atroalba]
MKRGPSVNEGSLSPPPTKRKYESTTTKKAIASFFTPVSKKEPEKIAWRIVNNSLLAGKYDPGAGPSQSSEPASKRTKIAAFDFDSTLIQTSSGNVFGKNAADWRWWHVSVPGVLHKLYADGYLVVILSNQGGISLRNDPKTVKSDQKRLSEFKAKVTSVFSQLDMPLAIYAATTRDNYRKPRMGMWEEVLDEYDFDVGDGPDLAHSVFVGDAGGRPKRNGLKEDHSSSDRDFAANVGIDFKTPEEYFLNEATRPFTRTFEPSTYLNATTTSTSVEANVPSSDPSSYSTPPFPAIRIKKKNSLDIVLLVGSPAAGKSSFYWRNLKPLGYERINQDTLKTRDRCLKIASEYLSSNKAVVIDNTNADPETRLVWIQLAQKFGIPIRCIYFMAPLKLCEHNDTIRALNLDAFNPEKRTILPHSAFSAFTSRFREPQLKEGFQDIIRIQFEFEGDEEQRKVWSRYWI